MYAIRSYYAVVREHAERKAVRARETGDLLTRVAGRHLEEGAAVDDELDRATDLVRAAALARDEREQLLLLAFRRVVAGEYRRTLPDVRRQVAEERARLPECLRLVGDHVVDDAALRVDLRPAELLLGDLLAQRALDERRSYNFV